MAIILVVTSAPPLVEGGHLVIARSIVRALREAGHQADLVTTPSNRFGRQASAYFANWLTDVGHTGSGDRVDQVITLRFPSYAVRHSRHVCWLNHTMREYYDLWDDFSGRLSPQGRLKESVRRRIIHTADSHFLKHHVTKLFAQSKTIQARLERWNHVPSEVLYPPPPQRPYRCDGYGDYLFFTSRLEPLKRADLVLRALAEPAAAAVRCVIGGEGSELPSLQELAKELGLDTRVTFTGRLDETTLVHHLAQCRGVIFIPKSEDYGFVTTEAFASSKAVVTTTDSGGPAELVRDGENGFVVEPNSAALAAAFAALADSPSDAARLGGRARQSVADMTWRAVAEKLVLP